MKSKSLYFSLGSFLVLLSLACAILFAGAPVLYKAGAVTEIGIDAPSALLMDGNTNTILFEKNATEHRPIASMVKMMTLILTYERIESGGLSLTDKIQISDNASSMGGSQAYLDANSVHSVQELIKSIVVASANDSCVALAENISGSVEGFVVKMNEKAAELGMNDTNFVNCTGLPATNQYSCAKDSAIMLVELIKYNDFFSHSKVWMYDYTHPSGRTTLLTNTNKLVRFYQGCDGGKTGFTSEAKYCLSATAKRGDSRFISVVIGAETSKKRNAEICKLFDYAFANYETRQIIFADTELGTTDVPNSKEKVISVAPLNSRYMLLKRGEENNVTYETEYFDIQTPIAVGDVVGKIIAKTETGYCAESDLVALTAATKQSFFDILGDVAQNW